MPDVFVPLDSIYFSGLLSEIAYSGIIRDYCFTYLDSHRKEMRKYKSSDEFINKFNVTDAMLSGLIEMAEKEEIKINKQVVRKISPQLKSRMKGQFARSLFDDDAMVKVSLESDPDFKRALQVAQDYKQFATVRKP
jgi:carboxyl-terminal processing protease